MNLSNIFESTDFVHASGTKEELQVAEFLKAQCEALGVPARLNIINLRKKWKGICSQVPFIVLKYRQGCI